MATTKLFDATKLKVKNEGFGFQVNDKTTGDTYVMSTELMRVQHPRSTMEANVGDSGTNADGSPWTIERERATWSFCLGIGSDAATDLLDATLRRKQHACVGNVRALNRRAIDDVFDMKPSEFATMITGRTKDSFWESLPKKAIDAAKYDENGVVLGDGHASDERAPQCVIFATAPVWKRNKAYTKHKGKMPSVSQIGPLPSTRANFPKIYEEMTQYYNYTPIRWMNPATNGEYERPCLSGTNVPDPMWSPIKDDTAYLMRCNLKFSIQAKNGGLKATIKDNKVWVVRELDTPGGNMTDDLPAGMCVPVAAPAVAAPTAEQTPTTDATKRPADEELEFQEFKRFKAAQAAAATTTSANDAVPPPTVTTTAATSTKPPAVSAAETFDEDVRALAAQEEAAKEAMDEASNSR